MFQVQLQKYIEEKTIQNQCCFKKGATQWLESVEFCITKKSFLATHCDYVVGQITSCFDSFILTKNVCGTF